MTANNQTNFLYLADTLSIKYPKFYKQFLKILQECKIDIALLPHTKDIWAVDYMPLQVSRDRFVQFVYNPDYLSAKKWQKTISDVDGICESIGIAPVKSCIVLDGGNVSSWCNKVLLTDKVFKENPAIPKPELIKELQRFFEVETIIIPQDPFDFTGHADGMVRFVNEDTVLVNDYSLDNPKLKVQLHEILASAKLKVITIPYCPHETQPDSAHGVYINYLQMKDYIFIPVFNIAEDDKAVKQFEAIFPGYTLRTINCNELAPQGGLLNCISWNIWK